MPLLPPVLQAGLLTLDEPSPGQDQVTCASKWFDAFWAYYSGCTQLNKVPLVLADAEKAARAVFVPILAAGMTPNPVPITFFLALEGAIRASLAITLTPVFMFPATFLVGIPSPVPLAPLLVPVVPIGMAAGSLKAPARVYLASAIAGWMYSNTVQTPTTPVPLV